MGSREIGSRVEIGTWRGLQRTGLWALSGCFCPQCKLYFFQQDCVFQAYKMNSSCV